MQYDSGTTDLEIANAGDTINFAAFGTSGVILSTTTIKSNGTDIDVSIGKDSAIFYDPVYMGYPSGTEAELKALIPSTTYGFYIDTTNHQVVLSTGTVNIGSFGATTDYITTPGDW